IRQKVNLAFLLVDVADLMDFPVSVGQTPHGCAFAVVQIKMLEPALAGGPEERLGAWQETQVVVDVDPRGCRLTDKPAYIASRGVHGEKLQPVLSAIQGLNKKIAPGRPRETGDVHR